MYRQAVANSDLHGDIKILGNLVLDVIPVVGDLKGFAEAETKFDYAIATVGLLGPVGDGAKVLLKEGKVLLEAGETVRAAEKVAEAQKALEAGQGANNIVSKTPDLTPGSATGNVGKTQDLTPGAANGVMAGGELSGTPTVIPPLSDAATTRSLIRENESASILANLGYKVEQNPRVPGSKNPDYQINGEIFDNYAPSTSSARNAASEINGKVEKGQANNIVVNLADSSITPAALRDQLTNYPIPGLKKVIVIDKSGAPIVMNFEGK